MDPDVDLLRLGLEKDAAVIAFYTLMGRTAEVDAYIEGTGYRDRLTTLRQSGRRATLPRPPAGPS